MRNKRPRSVSRVLTDPRSMLAQLKDEADHLRSQERVLHGILPAVLRARCQVARVEDDGELLLVTDTPAAASQLRYLSAALCSRISGRGGQAPRKLRVRIEPARGRPNPPARQRCLSQSAADHLSAMARHHPDERMREALLRLASRAEPEKRG